MSVSKCVPNYYDGTEYKCKRIWQHRKGHITHQTHIHRYIRPKWFIYCWGAQPIRIRKHLSPFETDVVRMEHLSLGRIDIIVSKRLTWWWRDMKIEMGSMWNTRTLLDSFQSMRKLLYHFKYLIRPQSLLDILSMQKTVQSTNVKSLCLHFERLNGIWWANSGKTKLFAQLSVRHFFILLLSYEIVIHL